MKSLTSILCLLVFALSPSVMRADLELTFQVLQKTDKPARDPEKDPPTRSSKEYTLTVTLGDDYIVSTGAEKTSAYDFKGKRIYWLDASDKTYHERSLYADIGFREAELRNRMMLQNVLKAGDIKENPFDTVLMEHLFSLKTPESKPLTPKPGPDQLSYSHGEKPLFSCTTQGRTLTPAGTRLFIRFLRYAYAAHPDILDELEKRHMVPNEFSVHRYNMDTDHFRFTLLKVTDVPQSFDPAELVSGLKKSETEIHPICARADAMTAAQFKAKCAELVLTAAAEGEAEHYLECIVLFLEYALSSGQPLPAEFQPLKAPLQADPTVKIFFGALNPKNKESAQKAADLIRGLRSQATKGISVLKIHEANNLTAAGKPDAARQLFSEVLTESPWIVGAWKDFGDLYYGAFEMGIAWQCWDTGRRLLPTQKQFDPVNQFERKLVTDHPEFF